MSLLSLIAHHIDSSTSEMLLFISIIRTSVQERHIIGCNLNHYIYKAKQNTIQMQTIKIKH